MFFILSIDFAAGVPQMPPPQTHASPVLRPVWQPELPHFLLPTPADRHPGSPVFLQYIPVQVIAVLHQIPESTHTGQKIFTVCLLL